MPSKLLLGVLLARLLKCAGQLSNVAKLSPAAVWPGQSTAPDSKRGQLDTSPPSPLTQMGLRKGREDAVLASELGSLIVEGTPIAVSEQASQGTLALSLQADQRQLSMPIQLLALSSAMTLVKARKSLLTPGLQRGSLCQYRGSEGECERAAYYGCGKGLKSVLWCRKH